MESFILDNDVTMIFEAPRGSFSYKQSSEILFSKEIDIVKKHLDKIFSNEEREESFMNVISDLKNNMVSFDAQTIMSMLKNGSLDVECCKNKTYNECLNYLSRMAVFQKKNRTKSFEIVDKRKGSTMANKVYSPDKNDPRKRIAVLFEPGAEVLEFCNKKLVSLDFLVNRPYFENKHIVVFDFSCSGFSDGFRDEWKRKKERRLKRILRTNHWGGKICRKTRNEHKRTKRKISAKYRAVD